MGSQRGAHYILSFLIFGVVAALAALVGGHTPDGEAIWLLVLSGLGVLIGSSKINDGKWAGPFDYVAGAFLVLGGLLGALHAFPQIPNFLPDAHIGAFPIISNEAFLGLPTTFAFPALVNLYLGIQSIRHGMSK